MAAGRPHDNEFRHLGNEFRDRDPNFDMSRQNSVFSKNSNRSRHVNRNQEQGTIRGLKDRARVRQKDIKERDAINGGYHSSSSKSDLETKHGFRVKSVDREPGELSSDSGSDDAIESEILDKSNDILKINNETKSSLNPKHRKFSPILWDRDERKLSVVQSTTAGNGNINLLPTKPPKTLGQSPNLITSNVEQASQKNNSKFKISNISLVNHSVTLKSLGGAVSETLASSSVQLQQHRGNDDDVDWIDNGNYVSTAWNITASRWADKASSPVVEGNMSDKEEMPKKRRRVFHSGSSDLNVNYRTSSLELGELKGDGTCSKSPVSAKAIIRARPFSSDGYQNNDYEKTDPMVLDDEHDTIYSGSSLSKSDSDDESDFRNTSDTPNGAHTPQRSVDMLQCCRSVNDFERINQIDEGTYGIVYRARDNKTGEIVALKKIKMEKEREGFPLTSLREINILLSFHHPSIVDVKEVVVGSSIDSIFMVMEYMEHDLKALMETMKQPFTQSEVKCLMLQLLEGVKYLHDNWVLHRDLKTSNLLLNNRGELKICDFGLSRQYGSPLKPYTHLVVTLWYRAPELLLGAKQYSTAIDMWSLGCIMAEILSKKPLFDGKTEVDQLDKIFRTLGTPSESIWPGFSKLPGIKFNFVKHQYNLLRKKFPSTSFIGSPILSDSGFDLLNKLLTYDPEKRITAEAALNHEWFHEVPLPKSKDFMPTFPAQHEKDRRLRRIMKSPDPLEEQRRKELQQGESGMRGLFC